MGDKPNEYRKKLVEFAEYDSNVYLHIPVKYGMCVLNGKIRYQAVGYWVFKDGDVYFSEWSVADVNGFHVWLRGE